MQKYLWKTIRSAGVIFMMFLLTMPVAAQTVNVTFVVNTSTNLDTLNENGAVEIRGSANGQTGAVLPGGKIIDWNSTSDLDFTNVGGDYWSGTFELNVGDTLRYKLWAGFNSDNGTSPDGGWEGPFNPSNGIDTDTRTFIVGATDTTLPTQFYHPNVGGAKVDQDFRPYAAKADSIAIYFRVNMGGVTELLQFDPAVNGPVGVRGDDGTSGGVINWGTTNVVLSREANSVNDGSFWSGVAYIPKDSVTAGSVQNYKFFIETSGNIDWESGGNRNFTYTTSLITGSMDTTLHWVNFDRKKTTGKTLVAADVTFRVSTEALEGIGLFDRGLGDQIAVIGAKGWSRPNDFIDLNFEPLLQEWTGVEPFSSFPGTNIAYKYFVTWDSTRVDPTSPNYIPMLTLDNGWEEPSAAGGGNRIFVYGNQAQQAPEGDFGFDRQFFASVPQNGWFANDVAVTFNINMAPAMDPVANTGTLFNPATDSVFIQMDGSLLAVTQGFEVGDAKARVVQLKDDDGDMVYSGTWNISGPGWYQLGYVIAYGTTANGFVTNGSGFDRGRRYYQFIHPTDVAADGSTTWPSVFNLPTMDWLEGAPTAPLTVETPPDLTQPTSVADRGDNLPDRFALAQNYPNPFNPETNIQYRVAQASQVEIKVYNLMGQLVRTLVDKQQPSGNYAIQWSGHNDAGRLVSSGVYFVKMKAGNFTKIRKMAFVK